MSNEDDLGAVFPAKPSELRQMPDEELIATYRKMAYANNHPYADRVQQELSFRLITALVAFKESSDRASHRIFWLTLTLVVLTGVLVWLTTRL